MTSKKSQTHRVLARLHTHGRITRNECLRNYISRLAARIADLREMGFNIEGKRLKNGDYEYTLVDNETRPSSQERQTNGEVCPRLFQTEPR